MNVTSVAHFNGHVQTTESAIYVSFMCCLLPKNLGFFKNLFVHMLAGSFRIVRLYLSPVCVRLIISVVSIKYYHSDGVFVKQFIIQPNTQRL